MKRLPQLFIFAAVTLSFSHAEEEPQPRPFTHKVAADFGKCPDGHKALVDVPIVYGHVGPLYKKPEDYTEDDRKLRDRRDRGEIVFGGDILHEHSPKSQVVCRQCGFRFHPSDMPIEFPEMAFWARNSNKPDDFRIKLSKELLEFPRMGAQEGTLTYSQSLSPDGGELDSESVSFHTSMPIEDVLTSVRGWLKARGGDPDDLERIKDAYAHHTYSYRAGGVMVSIQVDTYWEPGKITVSLLLNKVNANKARLDNPLPRPESDSQGDDKPQPESEGRSR